MKNGVIIGLLLSALVTVGSGMQLLSTCFWSCALTTLTLVLVVVFSAGTMGFFLCTAHLIRSRGM